MTVFVEHLVTTGVPLVLTAVLVAWAVHGRVRRRSGRESARRAALCVLLVATVAVLLWWTLLLSNPNGRSNHRINLTPLVEIVRGLKVIDSGYGVLNIWGNIAVFVPLGVLVTMLWRGRPLARVAAGTAAGTGLSAVIEATQYAVGRSADIDDVILNTTGALLGAALTLACLAIANRRGRGSGELEADD
jgi:glycopeptide antibiotics resistance protein